MRTHAHTEILLGRGNDGWLFLAMNCICFTAINTVIL